MKSRPLHRLEAAIVDSSAIMSIFENRPSAQAFRQGLKKSGKLHMSAGSLMELSVIFIGKKSIAGVQPLDALIAEFGIQIVPLDGAMVGHGRYGCANYGKGHHRADLNMGDLFSYSLAKHLDLPLYFEGLDFPQTDIEDAMAMLGYNFDAKHSPGIPQTPSS